MIVTNPKRTVDVTLAGDDTPADKRPTFTYRFFTCHEDLERKLLAEKAGAPGNTPERYHEILAELLGIGLVGWANLTDPKGKPIPFEPDNPRAAFRALTDLECWEVLNNATRETALSEVKKKRSSEPSTTAPASSAPSAPAPASA